MDESRAKANEMQCLNLIAGDLDKLGFNSHSKGFKYICHSVLFAVQDAKLLSSVNAKIFPKVALLFDTKPTTIERTCRYSLDAVYLEGGLKNINNLFGFNYMRAYERPKLTNFISTLAERNIARFNKLKLSSKKTIKKSAILKLNTLFKPIFPTSILAKTSICPDILL